MAKLLSGSRIYGNATVDTFLSVGTDIFAGNLVVNSISANIWQRLFTANVAESAVNLYFTNARVYSNVSQMSIDVFRDVDLTGLSNNYVLSWDGFKFVPRDINVIQGNIDILGSLTGQDVNVRQINATGNIYANAMFVKNDPVITLNPLNQSLALLRAQVTAPVGNVLYVAGNGNDANDGFSFANALANIHTALALAQPWTTVFVKSGDYILYNQPVTIKQRVGLVGDNLRTTTIRPAQPSVDMFYVNNASYVTGITFRDHISPAAVFSYNPDGSAGVISTSPYIQNCSSITSTGTGMRVDGRYVSGLRSMVCDSYTQTNAGGIGIHMLNQGYTQLVSVFTICCHIAILCESGGFCSITNSNSSFGDYGLVADGVSAPLRFGQVLGDQTGQEFTLYNITQKPNYKDAVLFANYNQAKCARDVGLIVDSLAIDLAYGSNTQSTFAGLQYWSQTESAIPGQAVETLDAIRFAKNLASNIALNTTITPTKQANVTQVSGTAGTVTEATIISDRFELIANIIESGTVGVTDRIISNQYPASVDVNVVNASNLIYDNKAFIAEEVLAYVNQTYPSFSYNSNTCYRDVGYMIDSVRFDLLHGGNKQSVMSGTYYYNYSQTATQINDQVVQTGLSYDYIGSILDEVVTATVLSKNYQTAVTQNTTAASAATTAQSNSILQNISLIKTLITNGPAEAHQKRPIAYTPSTDVNVINATKLILSNRDFITAEVVGYVNQNWANISNGTSTFYTVASSTNVVGNSCTITILENITDRTIFANTYVSFHIPSYIQTSTHTFEYIGSGTNLATALPYNGGIPIQGNETRETRGGAVYFTSTDQQGDFRIGKELLINRVDGTITGRTFNKSLFAVMTPYLLAIEG